MQIVASGASLYNMICCLIKMEDSPPYCWHYYYDNQTIRAGEICHNIEVVYYSNYLKHYLSYIYIYIYIILGIDLEIYVHFKHWKQMKAHLIFAPSLTSFFANGVSLSECPLPLFCWVRAHAGGSAGHLRHSGHLLLQSGQLLLASPQNGE